MAESLIGAWWARARRRLAPKPCPYSQAWVLDLPIRAWHAGPEKILCAFALKPGDRVLEIGPGTGYYSAVAAQMVGIEGRLICLDIQIEMLDELKRRLLPKGVASFNPVQGDACHLPIRSGSVDHVFLITVLGELRNRPLAVKEIRRVLQRNGRLSISEQFPDPDFMRLRVLRRELSAAGFVEERSHGRLVYTSTWRVDSTRDNAA